LKIIKLITFVLTTFTLISCGIYSFTGGNVGDAKTLQIDFFANEAPLVQPGYSQTFTQDLQDLFLQQTNLTLVEANGDLHFEGEIVGFQETPMSATGDQTAAQNRLTVTINVRYYNRLNEDDDFEKRFSFYSDVDSSELFVGDVLDTALEEINERITQDIFNASVAKW